MSSNFFMTILVSDEKLLWVLLRMPNWGFLVCNESLLSCCFWCSLYICLLVVWFLMCLGVHQFAFIIVQFIQLLGFVWFMVFIKFGEFGAIFFQIFFPFLLDLSKNRLVEVPMELCHFVSLEILNLYHNCIRVIPEAIINLQMLTYLNLR